MLQSLRRWAAGIVRRAGIRGPDVDDAIQSAYLDICARWDTFVPRPGQPEHDARRAWIAGFVQIAASEMRRRRERDRALHVVDVEDAAPPFTTPSHEGRVLSRDMLRRLRAATTSERWRVWNAFKVEGLSVEQIAALVGRPVPTIYNLVRLARLDLAAALHREAHETLGLPVLRIRRKPPGLRKSRG